MVKQFRAVTIFSSVLCGVGIDAADVNGCTALTLEFALRVELMIMEEKGSRSARGGFNNGMCCTQ